ncbi:MAG: His/Gly/Thr/Pro-type tRNA ligase C-terminal domain-containing protein, partial [Elusimicrobiota bacterium]
FNRAMLGNFILRAGVKFKDADLIGIPVRVTVSKRTLAKGSVEIKTRNQKESKLVDSGVALESALKELATFNLT